MLRLELDLSLCACAFISASVLVYQRLTKEGQIRLSSREDAVGNSTDETDDYLHVVKPDNEIDGDPVREKEFHKSIRWRKIVISMTTCTLLALQAGTVGWSVADKRWKTLQACIPQLLYSFYVTLLSIFAVAHRDESWHVQLTVHTTALSAIAVFSLSAVLILPSNESCDRLPKLSSYASLLLFLLLFGVSARMRRGHELYFPPDRLYPQKVVVRSTRSDTINVCGANSASLWEAALFSYTTKVVKLGYYAKSLEIADLPILLADMRAGNIFTRMKATCRNYSLQAARAGSGWQLAYRLLRGNGRGFALQISLIVLVAFLFYGPMFFMERLIDYLQSDPRRRDPRWSWIYCAGLFLSSLILALVIEQLWSLALTNLQIKIRIQLNTLLFSKTLVRKDVSSVAKISDTSNNDAQDVQTHDDDEHPSRIQIMNLMTTDVDRVAEFVWHFYTFIDAPIEIAVGTFFLYNLLGTSCFIGLAVTCLFLPMNNYAGKAIVRVQERLMNIRDKRVSLMNEVLGAVRMLKFMAWERKFGTRILDMRGIELEYQYLNYMIELFFISIWNISPLLVTLLSFWHFTVIRGEALTPSIAFTSIAIFSKLKFALNAIPGTMVKALQSFVSIRRIENYLDSAEVDTTNSFDSSRGFVGMQSATVTWPRDMSKAKTALDASLYSYPFSLVDVSITFPIGELSLVCGKLGSGKTLLLLSLLGEADLLSGEINCPRSPPNAITSFMHIVPPPEHWIVEGTCAYVPQTAWLQNATIRENVLFGLPYVEGRYQKTIEECALAEDLAILEDGDETEIGERGVNLSGGQKARVSLARAVYSRASILLLDDVLSAVDAHTAHHLYHKCLKGELACGRTIILVSHHILLCAPGASFVVTLDDGRVLFAGTTDEFQSSDVMSHLIQSEQASKSQTPHKQGSKDGNKANVGGTSSAIVCESPVGESATRNDGQAIQHETAKANGEKAGIKAPRKLVEDEQRAVGHISLNVWKTYFSAAGGKIYWTLFILSILIAAAGPVLENAWLSHWSGLVQKGEDIRGPIYYITIYTLITLIGLVTSTVRWSILYKGSINASSITYKKLLESVLFARIRFHDTASRGRLLNRFGKDIEVIDSSLPDNFGNTAIYFTSACTTLITITYVGGVRFFIIAAALGVIYYEVAKVYGRCCRELRRLDSISRSPLFSIYEETISGISVLRGFGATSRFMRDMISYVDASTNPYFWLWKVNRWVSTRVNLLSAVITGVTAVFAIINPAIDANLAGFTLVFAMTVTNDLQHMSMVAVERVKEYSNLPKEGPEFIEPRPPASWPSEGTIECDGLTVRYAPDLPIILRNLTFKVNSGEKIGIVGRTGSGKSTLALSFFRFVEATEGCILIDGIDISTIGLNDLRSRLTIIPQDPIILSGTLRSTLDVFDEYLDAEIFEALRRVHLIPPSEVEQPPEEINENLFRNLETQVSEAGENFSTGQKQLLCLARAILKRSKLIIMDEATASVDYATDELIGRAVRSEFVNSTIFTIAHRLRTIADYDRVMVLDQGRIVEFDSPTALLSDSSSYFYALCKAQGEEEFTVLKRLARALD